MRVAENRHDLLLAWASERGSGSWRQLQDAYDWLFPSGSREDWQTAGFTTGILSTLGHLEIDWAESRWCAAPPVLTLLPGAGAHALLTGGRTRTLASKLQEHEGEETLALSPLPPIAQAIAPSAWLVAVEDERAAAELASQLGIDYTYSVSETLSRILPTLDSFLQTSERQPPRKGYGVQKFDAMALRWSDVDRDEEPGLYRYDTPYREELRLRDIDEKLYSPVRSLGIWAALARWGENRLRYEPQEVNGKLIVPHRAPLPTLHARAAALCTGLAPEKWGQVLIYQNVPKPIAERIARSLDQSLLDFEPVARKG